MALPNLSDADRQAALKKAAEARQKRAALRAEIKSGKMSFADVMKKCDDPVVARMKVSTLLGVASRLRQGQGPQDHGRARDLREPSRAGPRCPPARAAPGAPRLASPPAGRRRLGAGCRAAQRMRTGNLFIISGPSGAGKGTLVRELCRRVP